MLSKFCALLAVCIFLAGASAFAQVFSDPSMAEPPPPSLHSFGTIALSGSVQARVEAWNWFYNNTRDRYAFGATLLQLNLSQRRGRLAWTVDLAQPALIGLPSDAVANGTPLGLGGTYFAANAGKNSAGFFVKQAYLEIRGVTGNGDALKLGRFTFIEGADGVNDNSTLTWLRRQRIAARLIGDAAWTCVGRSIDGVQFSDELGRRNNLTIMAGRPTSGVYQTDGWDEVNVDVLYGAFTRELTKGNTVSELRVFAAGYHDGRRVLKVDNRPLAAREADSHNIRIGTFGFDYLLVFPVKDLGHWDLMMWGALQTGNWGVLHHRAAAMTGEAGWQPPLKLLRPWLRAGAFSSSADGNPNDNKHATFFQMLPTERQYARIPFYTLQNVEDYTGQLILRPSDRLWLRTELHKVKLHGRKDLWYQGTGAFNNTSFGYTGSPARAEGGLANFLDFSADYRASSRLQWSCYFGIVSGKATLTTELRGRKAGFIYLETKYRF